MRGRLVAAFFVLFVFSTQIPATAGAADVDPSVGAAGRTEINIARIKRALRLTPEQIAAWAAVEATLIAIAREQAQEVSGAARPVNRHVVAVALTAATVRRLAAAAMPLIRLLDSEQKKVAVAFAEQIGLGAMARYI